jgi:hypothetical protein
MLDTAHNLTIDSMVGSTTMGVGPGGPVSSVGAAGVSASFAVPPLSGKSTSVDWYQKTTFGQRFLRLRNAVIPSVDISL